MSEAAWWYWPGGGQLPEVGDLVVRDVERTVYRVEGRMFRVLSEPGQVVYSVYVVPVPVAESAAVEEAEE